jgi:hypothetical protein
MTLKLARNVLELLNGVFHNLTTIKVLELMLLPMLMVNGLLALSVTNGTTNLVKLLLKMLSWKKSYFNATTAPFKVKKLKNTVNSPLLFMVISRLLQSET